MSIKGGYTPIIASTATTATTATRLVGQSSLTSWTPTLTCSTPGDLAVTYANRVGLYINNGNGTITISGYFKTSAFTYSTASGLVRIAGLPVPANASSQVYPATSLFQGITKANYTQVTPYLGENGTAFTIMASGQGQAFADLAITDLPSGGTVAFAFCLTYFI